MKLPLPKLLLLLLTPILLYAADPVVGSWQLNVAKSKYTSGPPPRSQTRIYIAGNTGVKAIVVTVYQDGSSDTVHYPANYDGKQQPVLGSADRDGIVMKRVDDSTAESILTHAGSTIGVARRAVAPDGKTMTITYKGIVKGEQVSYVAVFDKDPD